MDRIAVSNRQFDAERALYNLEHGDVGTGIDGIGNALGDIQVGQEVLTEIFLRSNLFHGGKIKKKIADLETCDSFFNFSRSITYCCLH